MTTIASTSLDAAFAELRGRVAGPVLDPRSPGYDEVRQVWNGAVDRRPAVIIRCSSTADVVKRTCGLTCDNLLSTDGDREARAAGEPAGAGVV